MSKYVIAIVAAAGLAGAAFGQVRPTSATYGFRLVPQGAAAGLTNGGTSTLTAVTFVLQAQATTAAGTTNYGIHRMSSGTITASTATLSRGLSNGTTNFGRFRGPGLINNFAAQAAGLAVAGNPAATNANSSNSPLLNALSSDLAANVNGRFNAGNTVISQIDAWRGAQTGSQDVNGDPVANPFDASLVTSGAPSAWANLYSFTVIANAGATAAGASVNGFLNIAAFYEDVGGNWTSDLLAAPTQVSTSFNWVIPTPGAAALLGLGGLAAARRRR